MHFLCSEFFLTIAALDTIENKSTTDCMYQYIQDIFVPNRQEGRVGSRERERERYTTCWNEAAPPKNPKQEQYISKQTETLNQSWIIGLFFPHVDFSLLPFLQWLKIFESTQFYSKSFADNRSRRKIWHHLSTFPSVPPWPQQSHLQECGQERAVNRISLVTMGQHREQVAQWRTMRHTKAHFHISRQCIFLIDQKWPNAGSRKKWDLEQSLIQWLQT